MIPLTLVETTGKEFTFELPKGMDEMTVKQLEFLSKLLERADPVQEIKTKMLLFCMGARLKRKRRKDTYYRVRAKRRTFKMSADNFVQAVSVFDYLFTEDKDGNSFLDNRLTICPYPVIRIFGLRFYPPAQALTDIVYDRYVHLETYFERMQQEPKMIYPFLGTLLRPKEKQFDKNRLFLSLMRFVQPRKIILLTWFFIGSMRFIRDKFPKVFSASGKGTGKSTNLYDSQQLLLDFIAKADPDKKIRLKYTNLYEVLYSLNYIMEQAEQERKQAEKLKNKIKK